ncbi:MAG: VaFE repeat-containing surface-anchored protein [Erysipelotrichaceae bacterium]|nr:VaFE repeat-containing surface-anchored protein [Erysipelotrichaceae bacterium]
MFTLVSSILAPCRDDGLYYGRFSGFKETAPVSDDDPAETDDMQNTKIGMEEDPEYMISYVFAQAGAADGIGKLPEDVLDLLPDPAYGKTGETVKPEDPAQTIIGSWVFLGWEPGSQIIDGQDIVFSGLWKNADHVLETYVNTLMYKAASVLYSGFGTIAWGLHSKGGYTGTYNFLLGGEQSYCLQADKTVPAAGSVYNYAGEDNSKLAEIIGKGTYYGMSPGAIQATLWNYLKSDKTYAWVDSGENVDYDSRYYSASGQTCSIEVYSPGNSSYQKQGKPEPCPDPVTGKIQIIKQPVETDFDYVNKCPNNYSLAGAEYGIFKDIECTDRAALLKTKSNGKTSEKELKPGTYFVKELKPSPGFQLDENVYTAKVVVSKTAKVESYEPPLNDPFNVLLYKENARDREDVSFLEEAEFTLKYYDTQKDSLENIRPVYTWVFRPIINQDLKAEVLFDAQHFLRGDDLLLDENGEFFIPIGTFTIEETKAPRTFARDENIYIGHIVYDNGTVYTQFNGGQQLQNDDQILVQSENKQAVIITVQKIDAETGEASPQGFASLEDAQFLVSRLNEESGNKETVGTIVTDSNGKGSLSKDSEGIDLLPGIYFIKETKAPDGYLVNEEEFRIDALIQEENTAVFEYITEVEEQVTETVISKKDSEGNYLPGAQLELIDENGLPVFSWTTKDTPEIIKGLTYGKRYTVHEKKTPDDSVYAYAEDIEIVPDNGKEDHTIVDGIVAIRTTAGFGNTADKTHVADGTVVIKDRVSYEWLYPGKRYLLKGQLIDKSTEKKLMETEMEFIPESTHGTVYVDFMIDLEGYDDRDFVVFEELYLTDENGQSRSVVSHKDLNDPDQTVHIERLYRAEMVLYKTNTKKTVKLNGALFHIETKRIRSDGTLCKQDLGTFITGGIYLEKDEPFCFYLSEDPQMKNDVQVFDSRFDSGTGKHIFSTTLLEEGVYYGKTDTEDEIKEYRIRKGSIILSGQPENTEITYTETAAPKGYFIDKKPFTVNVGSDYTLETIENYRTNIAIILPDTGIERDKL